MRNKWYWLYLSTHASAGHKNRYYKKCKKKKLEARKNVEQARIQEEIAMHKKKRKERKKCRLNVITQTYVIFMRISFIRTEVGSCCDSFFRPVFIVIMMNISFFFHPVSWRPQHSHNLSFVPSNSKLSLSRSFASLTVGGHQNKHNWHLCTDDH